MGVTAKQLLDLQCCDLTDPLGVGGEVFFSWRCCGFFQKSYRVQITDESGACVLDTGEIASDRPFTDRLIPPLRSSARYRWSVCVTDRQGERIQSGTAVFETALLEEKELAVPFITSEWENPVFMKTFTACAGETGRLYIAGLGYYDLFINGRRVADTYFSRCAAITTTGILSIRCTLSTITWPARLTTILTISPPSSGRGRTGWWSSWVTVFTTSMSGSAKEKWPMASRS